MTVEEKLAALDAQQQHWETRFRNFFPESDDLVAVVLRGHLLIEEILEELIRNYAFRREFVAKARLSFYHKAMLAKAFLLNPLPDDVWDSILALNSLRNAFAHSLEPEKIEEKIRQFNEYRRRHSTAASPGGQTPVKEVGASISYLIGQLSMLDIVTKYMESCKRYG